MMPLGYGSPSMYSSQGVSALYDQGPLTSSGSGSQSPGPHKKIRKPYTITKPRECWTEDEHQRFIEGLRLYERDWKKIQAHVGTKNVMQIRSHAQKFFLKVQKQGGATHIPPARPKRKASTPYPQKILLGQSPDGADGYVGGSSAESRSEGYPSAAWLWQGAGEGSRLLSSRSSHGHGQSYPHYRLALPREHGSSSSLDSLRLASPVPYDRRPARSPPVGDTRRRYSADDQSGFASENSMSEGEEARMSRRHYQSQSAIGMSRWELDEARRRGSDSAKHRDDLARAHARHQKLDLGYICSSSDEESNAASRRLAPSSLESPNDQRVPTTCPPSPALTRGLGSHSSNDLVHYSIMRRNDSYPDFRPFSPANSTCSDVSSVTANTPASSRNASFCDLYSLQINSGGMSRINSRASLCSNASGSSSLFTTPGLEKARAALLCGENDDGDLLERAVSAMLEMSSRKDPVRSDWDDQAVPRTGLSLSIPTSDETRVLEWAREAPLATPTIVTPVSPATSAPADLSSPAESRLVVCEDESSTPLSQVDTAGSSPRSELVGTPSPCPLPLPIRAAKVDDL